MSEVSIREAEPPDIPALHALIESAYRGEVSRAGWTTEADLLAGQRTDAEDLAAILADARQAMLLAERDGVSVGCVLIAERGEGLGYFGMLAVSPTLQSAGLGQRLVSAAERELAARFGADRVQIRVFPQRDSLIAWYRRLGYAPTGETAAFPYNDPRLGLPLRDDLHFVIFEKRLAEPQA